MCKYACEVGVKRQRARTNTQEKDRMKVLDCENPDLSFFFFLSHTLKAHFMTSDAHLEAMTHNSPRSRE